MTVSLRFLVRRGSIETNRQKVLGVEGIQAVRKIIIGLLALGFAGIGVGL